MHRTGRPSSRSCRPAACRCSRRRTPCGASPGVRRRVHPRRGESFGEIFAGFPATPLGEALRPSTYPLPEGVTAVELSIAPELYRSAFAADLPSEVTEVAAVTQRPFASIFEERAQAAAWKKVPSWAVVATADNAIHPDAERHMANRAGAQTIEIEKVGELQGSALVDTLKQDGTIDKGEIVMINGAPTDNNAGQSRRAPTRPWTATSRWARSTTRRNWSPDKAQQEMEQAITALGKNKIVGVYAANDGTAGGAIAAMKANGVDPSRIPVTGQDAELAAIQRIVAGEHYMTVYKAIKPEAEAAADLASALVKGEKPKMTDAVNNGNMDVPSKLLTPVSVTTANIMNTVVRDGFHKVTDICTGQFTTACEKAGIK